jgi:hypothetical protein
MVGQNGGFRVQIFPPILELIITRHVHHYADTFSLRLILGLFALDAQRPDCDHDSPA